jgi:two-component system, NtrC family, sensor kinase
MKLTIKMYMLVAIVMLGSLSAFGYSAYRRDMRQFESDVRDKCRVLGRAMAAAVSDVWRVEGQQGAQNLIRDASATGQNPSISWLWINPPANRFLPRRLSDSQTRALSAGREVMVFKKNKDLSRSLCAYFPVRIPGDQLGVLELKHPSEPMVQFAHRNSLHLILTAIIILIAGGALMIITGQIMIGKPLKLLHEHARTIGQGNFSQQMQVSGHDEISSLARAMNAMSQQLEAIREHLKKEHKAHVHTIEALRHTERLSTLGQLASGVAHELGTPLNVIAGRAKLIACEDLNPSESNQCAKIIIEQSKRMTAAIQHFLDFARRRTPKMMAFDLTDLVRSVKSMLQHIASKNGIAILLNGCDVPVFTRGDITQLRQVLVNLVMNGLQSMVTGGELLIALCQVEENTSQKDDEEKGCFIELTIKDQGVGIPEKDLPFVMDPYFTAKSSGEGTGLGLSIVNDIVKEHGGRINISSKAGIGTSVTIYFHREPEK